MNLPLSGIRFLVVEDDTTLLLILERSLTKKGAVVTTACNGQEAWKIFQETEFDIVLSDVQMPEMTGVELLGKIRELDPKKPVFLLVTGQAQVSEQEALSLGAAALVQKPFRLSNFMVKLEEILSHSDFKRVSA